MLVELTKYLTLMLLVDVCNELCMACLDACGLHIVLLVNLKHLAKECTMQLVPFKYLLWPCR